VSGLETIPGIPVKFVSQVSVAWRGAHVFEAGRTGGPQVRIDSGAREGPSPVDALLIALGTCTAVDVVEILSKRRTPVQSLSVDVQAARADATPRRVIGALLTYRIAGPGIERTHAERAINLAINRYCSVRDSIDPAIPVNWELVLESSQE
jgi:putative redox protein